MSDNVTGHLLVVDDDDRIRDLLSRYLGKIGHRVIVARNAAEARKYIDIYEFDLLILDVMMPGEDGISLTKALRQERRTPILLLTARGEPVDRIEGLSAGADDYLPKPFEPEELSLRIAAILRRSGTVAPMERMSFGTAEWDVAKAELRRDGAKVRLTDAETRLMMLLASRPGDLFTREELARRLSVASERTVDVQVTRLRRKLDDDATAPAYLQTVRSQGYRLVPSL